MVEKGSACGSIADGGNRRREITSYTDNQQEEEDAFEWFPPLPSNIVEGKKEEKKKKMRDNVTYLSRAYTARHYITFFSKWNCSTTYFFFFVFFSSNNLQMSSRSHRVVSWRLYTSWNVGCNNNNKKERSAPPYNIHNNERWWSGKEENVAMSRGRKKRKGIESKTITENVWKREKGDNQEVAPRVCVCRAITGARVSHAQYEKKKRSGHWRFRASRVFCLLSRCQNPPWFFSANEEIDTIDFVSPLEQSALPLSSERWTAKERRPSRLTCSDQEGGVYDNELLTSARTDSEYLISSTNPPKKKKKKGKVVYKSNGSKLGWHCRQPMSIAIKVIEGGLLRKETTCAFFYNTTNGG